MPRHPLAAPRTLAVLGGAFALTLSGRSLPALNEMFDITTTRTVAVRNHPPLAIFILLGACCLVGSLLVGYTVAENKTRRGLHTLGFAFIMALAVYVIIDLEYPRLGLIRIDAADQVLIDLRASMD